MIFQGLFNILSIYLNQIELFYNYTEEYFREIISSKFKESTIPKDKLLKNLNQLINLIKEEMIKIGFDPQELENKFLDPFLEINEGDHLRIHTIFELYDKKIAPLLYEIFLEKIVDYLVDVKASPLMLNLKEKGFLPLELIIELRNLKNLIEKYPEKKEILRKYIKIQQHLIEKLNQSKKKIESLEDLKDPKDKLQLIYLIYRIISFFHLEKRFDFSHIKEYILNNMDEWLITIPLVTLKNPDLYFCGLYLAIHLKVPIDKNRVIKFLMELYEEGIDEFEAPLLEATDGLYYFFKSTNLMKLWLTQEQITNLIKADPKFFEPNYLKNLETSQLVVILKIYKLVNATNIEDNIKAIIEEIERRMTPEGIKQYRDGFVSSEATYYVLFCNYSRDSLDKLKDYNLLEAIVSRIYRNLEILDFSADMSYDLLSELFYSFESLKLFNCIETKQMIIHLARYLFPQEILEKVENNLDLIKTRARFRHLKVDKITGETIY
ncbi:MAG: hypothetical protein ACTSRH_05770 [Promethearchaeota archaeon]